MSADRTGTVANRASRTGDTHQLEGLALRTNELTAGYANSPVVHGVTISVAPGEVVSIVGPNGSGKSTLLKAIVGVAQTLGGSVLVGEQDVTNWHSDRIARLGVGYVPQVDDVFAPLTVGENLDMGGYVLHTRALTERTQRVLEVFPQLAGMLSRRAGKLSGGERKMLAMGRALIPDPGLVVLDEPTANLAPAVAATVLNEHVPRLSATGASVLIVEQRARAVLAVSDRTYVLGGGKVRMEGTPSELAESREFVESFLGGSAS